MCWCNPSIRTPNCGSPGCHPPQEIKIDTHSLSTKAVLGKIFLIDGRPCVAIPIDPTPEEEKLYTDWMNHMHTTTGKMITIYQGVIFAATGNVKDTFKEESP
jgi:hypothetical protein